MVNPVFENAITEPTQPLSSDWPGQEPGPLQVATAAADKAEEDAVARAAEEKAAEEERAAKKAAVRGGLVWGFMSSLLSCCCDNCVSWLLVEMLGAWLL